MLFRGILVWWCHPCKLQTKEYNFLPVRRKAGNVVHQTRGKQRNSSPSSHGQDVPGLLSLLCWSHSWTQLVTTGPTRMLPSLRCCSDERSWQDSTTSREGKLRRSLWWTRPAVQVQSRILQNIRCRNEPTYADCIYFTSWQTKARLKVHFIYERSWSRLWITTPPLPRHKVIHFIIWNFYNE